MSIYIRVGDHPGRFESRGTDVAGHAAATKLTVPEIESLGPYGRDLLVALAQGASNKVLARRCGLREGSIKNLVSRWLLLFGARNRAHLVTRMLALKIVTLDELLAPTPQLDSPRLRSTTHR